MADADSSLTPEKRLLKLIEEPQSEKPEPPRKSSLKDMLSPAAIKVRLGLMREKAGVFFRTKKDLFNVRTLNGAVTSVTILLAAVFLINTVYEMKTLNTDTLTEQLIIPASKMVDMMPIDLRDDATSLLETPEEDRNVFLPFGKRNKEVVAQTANDSIRLVEMTKDLKLTGISFNPENPDRAFCMIEDLSKNVTLFLRAGDQILGMKVQKINPNTVVLEYQGDTLEIR